MVASFISYAERSFVARTRSRKLRIHSWRLNSRGDPQSAISGSPAERPHHLDTLCLQATRTAIRGLERSKTSGSPVEPPEENGRNGPAVLERRLSRCFRTS